MTKSKQYHLNYKIISVGETRIPIIECDVNSSGTSLNIELASFMDKGGKDFTQDMIDYIVSLDAFSSATNGHVIFSANEYDMVEIFSPPARASFWNGIGYTDIPLQDFIDILNEWKAFLNSIPFQHTLSNQ